MATQNFWEQGSYGDNLSEKVSEASACPAEPMLADSKMDLPLSKAKKMDGRRTEDDVFKIWVYFSLFYYDLIDKKINLIFPKSSLFCPCW